MDIQEAIEHARQVSDGCDAQNRDCAYQHDKLADWLTILKQIAEIFNCDPNDPAQLKQFCNKLRGWKQAEQDGRLVVLPCKVGDTVYRVVGLCSWPGAECPDESRSCSKCRETRKVIIEAKIENIEGAVIISEYWGKTVFATRQEAEAAVERKEENT